jgi:hypothetical protein
VRRFFATPVTRVRFFVTFVLFVILVINDKSEAPGEISEAHGEIAVSRAVARKMSSMRSRTGAVPGQD